MDSLPSKSRSSRRRDPRTHRAILEATRELLLDGGYQQMSIEAVARRSGVGKATIYRWWRSKGELVLEACEPHLEIGLVPDTGTTRGDIVAAAEQLIRTYTDPFAALVIFVVIAHLDDDPELAAAFRRTWVMPWRESLSRALERGVVRGDLAPDCDVAFLLDIFVGTIFQRTLVMQPALAEGLGERLADFMLKRSV